MKPILYVGFVLNPDDPTVRDCVGGFMNERAACAAVMAENQRQMLDTSGGQRWEPALEDDPDSGRREWLVDDPDVADAAEIFGEVICVELDRRGIASRRIET